MKVAMALAVLIVLMLQPDDPKRKLKNMLGKDVLIMKKLVKKGGDRIIYW